MGWNISTKEIKGETKYKIWSTIVDSNITPKWLSRDEVIKFLFWDRLREFMTDFMKDSMTFPSGWRAKDGSLCLIPNEQRDAFYEFQKKSIQDDDLFLGKVSEELKKHGISINIDDGTYNFTTKNES